MLPSSIAPGTPGLRAAFLALTLLVAALFVIGNAWAARRTGLDAHAVRRRGLVAALAAAAWIAITGAAASRGILHFDAPPTMLVAIVLSLALAVAFALSPAGRRVAVGLPLHALVGYQAFRIGVEIALHRAYREGLMPVQMSWSGRNFDIITGLSALVLGLWLMRATRTQRALVLTWNTLGLALLLNVLVVALLSAPTPLRVFMNEPSNVWITHAPWVWLPAVMVPAALCGHLLVYRRFVLERG